MNTLLEHMFINEIGDNASVVTWKKESGTSVGIFSVKGEDFTIVINPIKKCKEISVLNFKFYNGEGSIDKTNLMLFHLSVGPVIKREFLAMMDKEPECIIFSSNKTEKSRVRIYDKWTAFVAKKYGYEQFYKTAITSDDDEYALVRKDKIQAFKDCFKENK